MDRRANNHITRILQQSVAALRSNRNHDERWLQEERADRELVSYTQKVMRDSLAAAAEKGRSGWWREDECTVQHLENLLQKAIDDRDYPSVINYAAMLEVRRLTDE